MKKRSTRIITLSTALVALALSASIGYAEENNSVNLLGDGSDFDLTGRASWADVSGNTTNLSAYTEGEGKDLDKVRVYSYFYINGNLIDTDYDNDPSYAYVEFTKTVTQLNSTEIRSSHYAYNSFGDKIERVSEAYWPE